MNRTLTGHWGEIDIFNMSASETRISGFVTFGEIASHFSLLDVACNRCDRRGRLRVDQLVAEHGANLPMPELRHILAADCPRMVAGQLHDVSWVHFPGLAADS